MSCTLAQSDYTHRHRFRWAPSLETLAQPWLRWLCLLARNRITGKSSSVQSQKDDFGRWAKGMSAPIGKYVAHEPASLKFDGPVSSAVSPAARAAKRLARRSTTDSPLPPQQCGTSD